VDVSKTLMRCCRQCDGVPDVYELLELACRHCKFVQYTVDNVKVFRSSPNASERLEMA
jgi:hypothetical protein